MMPYIARLKARTEDTVEGPWLGVDLLFTGTLVEILRRFQPYCLSWLCSSSSRLCLSFHRCIDLETATELQRSLEPRLSCFNEKTKGLRCKSMCQGPQKVAAKLGLTETRLPHFLDEGSSWGPNYINPILQTKDRPIVKISLITMKRKGLGPGSPCV